MVLLAWFLITRGIRYGYSVTLGVQMGVCLSMFGDLANGRIIRRYTI